MQVTTRGGTRLLEVGGIEFDEKELRDLGAAWIALGLAFTFFLAPQGFVQAAAAGTLSVGAFGQLFAMSIVTVGSGFLLHELSHKIVAIRFGQIAAFRADYPMLGLAVASGLAGFLFAAPGAVHHRGYITDRENGIIAVAGPLTNLALATAFLVFFVLMRGFPGQIAAMGVVVNVFLAAFNMVPFGPLDGQTVLAWSEYVFGAVFAVSVLATVGAFVTIL